jgi:hypothetical protein
MSQSRESGSVVVSQKHFPFIELGLAWLGLAWLGLARLGLARLGYKQNLIGITHSETYAAF